MKNKFTIIIILLAIVAGGYYFLKPKPSMDPNMQGMDMSNTQNQDTNATPTKTFILVVRDRKLFSSPDLLKVTQGDQVSIRITSNTAEELHLHGYDKMVEIPANQTSQLDFVADKTGRFPYELEREGIEIGNLEVDPK